MCCEMPIGRTWHHYAGCWYCCPPRRFLTKKERVTELEEYAKALEKELTGVKERIDELKKKS